MVEVFIYAPMSDPKYTTYIDVANVQNFVRRLKEVRKFNILDIYKRFYQYYRRKTRARYLKAAQDTPYAESSLGRKKRNGTIITQDSLFGIDTTALFQDFTQNVKIDDSGLRVWSDLVYAGYIENLFQEKGPYAPEGVLHVDEDDLVELEVIILQEYQEGFGKLPDNFD